MREDYVLVFLDGSPTRAAVQYQRMSKRDQERTFWVQTVGETIDMLERYRTRLDVIMMGYSLTDAGHTHPASEECGLEVVRWLEKQDSSRYSHARFVVHTWDFKQGKRMTERLTAAGYKAKFHPFGS